MCVKNIVKTAVAFMAMFFALLCLMKMFASELSTGTSEKYSLYFYWAFQAGLLMISTAFAYICFCGENDIRTSSADDSVNNQ